MRYIGKHPIFSLLLLMLVVTVLCVTTMLSEAHTTQELFSMEKTVPVDSYLISQVKFYGSVIILLVTVIQGLVSFIYLSGRKSDRDFLNAKLETMGTELNGLGKRVNDTEKNIENIYGHLDEIHTVYLSKEDHDRICKVVPK